VDNPRISEIVDEDVVGCCCCGGSGSACGAGRFGRLLPTVRERTRLFVLGGGGAKDMME